MTGDPQSQADATPFAPEHCRYFERLFSPYIAGELDGDSRRALAEHLHECESCAEKFGLAWRAEATGDSGGQLSALGSKLRATAGNGRRRMLWWMTGVCGVGVLLLLGRQGGAGQSGMPVPTGRALVDAEVARTIALQNRLLEVLVEPLRGGELHVSHTARGEAKDWFASFAERRAGGTDRVTTLLHSQVRVIDQAPGGSTADLTELVQSWRDNGIPDLVLVEVRDATRQALLCKAVWNRRPAHLFLVREEREGEGEGAEVPGPGWPPMRLTLVLFTEP